MPYKDPAAHRKYMREWRAARKAAWFADKSCAWCGSGDDLELDHVDPRTKITHNVWTWSEARRQAELAKCQVLCHTCHVMKSIGDLPITRGQDPAWHGRWAMYCKGCRCAECVQASNAHKQSWRDRKRQELTGV